MSTGALLLLAGHETTTHLIGNGIIALLRHPAELRRLRESPELIASAVEEFQRYNSPSGHLARVLTEDTKISGQVVPAGQVVSGVVWAANRDPEIFDDPNRFDVTRNDSRHLGFGGGPHLCLGAALARLETKIAVRALLTRFPNLQLADDNLVWLPSIAIRGVQSLPVTI